tara:strand:- start:2690 stop:3472 length:783 start_codon:yes stop_codon:yes gene_type:complete
MFINNFDPVAFKIFSYGVHWYSLSYIAGILIGWFLAKKLFIKDINIKRQFDDYLTYLIIGLILGGRIGYILFYNPIYYLENITDALKIWQGGMSFHGGLIGIIFSSYLFAKKNNINIFKYLDIVALGAPIGIFFGRISNFINSELYGYETSVPWAVQFIRIDNLYRHPSQIYEATLEGLILFIIMLYFWKKNYLEKTGKVSAIFLIFYSFFRFLVEFFRVPDEQLGYVIFNLTMGQIISIVFFIFGVVIIFNINDIQKKS